MKEINTLIIGASAFACGLASRLGADCLVVERGFSAGAEFADAMSATPIDLTREYSDETKSLVEELKSRNILSEDGRLHILALAGVLAGRFLQYGARMLHGASVISVEPISRGRLATVFTPEEGYTQIIAKQVIDTRVRDFMDATKIFSVMLAGGRPELAEAEPKLLHGRFDDEYILRFSVARDASLPECEELADAWLKSHKSELNGAKAASISLEFGWEFPAPLDETRAKVRHIPSASYADVISAFEGGESLCL